jgi:hypothetical protein
MKATLTALCAGVILLASMSFKPIPCGKHNGKNLYKGEKGGCYYLKGKKKEKVYIDRKFCKC